MRGVSLAIAVTPSSNLSQPELQIQLGAFDIASSSKPGEYNGFLHDNYHRVNLVGLQMQIAKGDAYHLDERGSSLAGRNASSPTATGGSASQNRLKSSFFMKLQTNVQIKNEPVTLKRTSSSTVLSSSSAAAAAAATPVALTAARCACRVLFARCVLHHRARRHREALLAQEPAADCAAERCAVRRRDGRGGARAEGPLRHRRHLHAHLPPRPQSPATIGTCCR